MLKCPMCGAKEVGRFNNVKFGCDECDYIAEAEKFGVKCTCAQPHYTPLWYCPAHGEVVVPMD
jgi:hypothetical protein